MLTNKEKLLESDLLINGDEREENINLNWRLQKKKRDKFLKKYPNALTGRINWYGKKGFKPLKDVEFYNFSWDFAIPEYDSKLDKLLIEYNKAVGKDIYKYVKAVTKRIEKIKGIHFYWI